MTQINVRWLLFHIFNLPKIAINKKIAKESGHRLINTWNDLLLNLLGYMEKFSVGHRDSAAINAILFDLCGYFADKLKYRLSFFERLFRVYVLFVFR